MKIKKILLLVLLAAMLPGCFIWKRVALKNCEYKFAGTKIKEIALTYLKLELIIDVTNPNSIEVVFDRIAFDLYVNDEKIAKGSHNVKTKIPSGESAKIRPVVTVNYSEIQAAVLSAIKKFSATYKVVGTVYFDTAVGSFSFPVTIIEGET
ncbi:LEA type 2 family protein [candidate division WOR-3 bacterium]|nr:LEA type 2 family protein [candidate division WOR-3 bacterium]